MNGDKDFLFECILSLETVEECYDFFEDLCTPARSRKCQSASARRECWLKTASTREVVNETGLSNRYDKPCHRCLKEGSDGYATVLSRVKKDESL